MSNSPNRYDIDMEAEANEFAIELLMPTAFVRHYIATHGAPDLMDGGESLKVMAKKFGVSPSMMAFRLGRLEP